MKKGLVFATIACTFALGLVACKKAPSETHTVSITNKDTFANGIWTDDLDYSISVSITNSDVITADAFLAGDLVVTSSNTSVLTITGNNRLTPVAAGTSTVKAIYKNNESWADSVDIVVHQRPTQRIVLQPEENKEYRVGMINSSGQVWANGEKTGYYLEVKEGLDNACKAKVVVKADATDDYKYSIELETASEGYKAIGFVINASHYNIGYEGEKITDTGVEYTLARAYFKVGSNGELSIKQDTTELFMGTYGTYTNSLSWRTNDPTDPKKIEFFAHLYEEGDPIPATAISVTPTELALDKGANAKINYTLTPATSTDKVVFLSLDTNIATVSDNGVVTGVAQGETTITVSANSNVFATVPVTVSATAKHGTTADDPLTVHEAVEIAKGEADETVYYVQGVVSEIVSAYNSQYGNMSFNVTNNDGEVFQFYKTSCTSVQATNVVLGARVLGHGQITKFNTTYEFKWVQNSVESTLDDVSVPSEVTLIVISGGTQVNVNDDLSLTATLYPEGTTGTVAWTSSVTAKATVSDAGVVHGVAEGKTNVTATVGTVSATVEITVNPAGTDLWATDFETVELDAIDTDGVVKQYVIGQVTEVVNETYGNMYIASKDGTKTLYVYGTYAADGTTRYDSMATKPVVGDVVVLYGIGTIYSEQKQVKNVALAQLNGEACSITSVALNKTEASVEVGATDNLAVEVTPIAATGLLGTVAWASLDPEKVSVSDAGVITGVAQTTDPVNVTATPAGRDALTCAVTVIAVTPGIALADAALDFSGCTTSSTALPSENWDYITNNPSYPNPGFYAGGLKLNYQNMGLITKKLVSSDSITVTLTVAALNAKTSGTASGDDVFTVYGLAEDGTTVLDTKTIDVTKTGNVSCTLSATAIRFVKIIMTSFAVNSAGSAPTKPCNLSLGGVTLA